MKNTCFLLLLFSLLLLASYISFADHNVMCVEKEREALLKFKEGIQVDRCGLMSSWGDDDDNRNCCQWHGVRCNNLTGHVIKLDLQGVITDYLDDRCLEGKVSSSLINLKHLSYLDLSFNNFKYQPIPTFIGSLVNLKHLNLSLSYFEGEVPNQLRNLSRLTSLDLSSFSTIMRYYDESFDLYVRKLSWISNLTYLKYIDLSGVDLSNATNWFKTINNLPYLRVLHLDSCTLPALPPQIPSYQNSSTTFSVISLNWNYVIDESIFQWLFNLSGIHNHLSYLDLSSNQLKGPIPTALENLQSLSYLDLGDNQLEGPIPDTISNIKLLTYLILSSNNFQFIPKTLGNLCNLQVLILNSINITEELQSIIQKLNGCVSHSLLSLSLDRNNIWGSIPDTIDTFSSLTSLNLGSNLLNGTISQSLGNLSMLERLDLSSNSLKGTLSSNHFSNLSRLTELDLSNNSALLFNLHANWVSPFQLQFINLRSFLLGPMFPNWLERHSNISSLDISCAGISDSIPKSFWKSLSPNLIYLNMSHNNISGTILDLQIIALNNISSDGLEIDMSFNNIEGKIPSFPKHVNSIFLNNNKFSDQFPFMCPKSKTNIKNLDLSNNLLYGELQDCWMNFDQLLFLNLENNNFSGSIPMTFGYLNKLQSLHLGKNNFSKDFPTSLLNITSLVNLNLGHNSFGGHIPIRIGDSLVNLRSLIVRSNNIVGEIPSSLCNLPYLQILDLSINHITGAIPKCIHNLTAMQNGTDLMPDFSYIEYVDNFGVQYGGIYEEVETVMWNKKEWSFVKHNLGLLKVIDLSDNKLGGEIPYEISALAGLVILNLSRNHLHGNINAIEHLTSLENLDLSNNHLSGEIPTGLADFNSLGILNLSYNHFSGKIPNGPLLQGYDTSSYEGNPQLCGMPLPRCSWEKLPDNNNPVNEGSIGHQDKSESDNFFLGLCISVVLGFILGFWGVCGTLVLKRSWRRAFFQFFDYVRDNVYVMVFVNIAGIRRRL